MEHHQYFGTVVQQRESADVVRFFVFYATARDVTRWAGVRRVEDSQGGIQRILKPGRVSAITRFISSDHSNTIPGSVLVAFTVGATTIEDLQDVVSGCLTDGNLPDNGCDGRVRPGMLSFQFDPDANPADRPAMIVDGQHRLHGIANFEDGNIPVLVVALIDAPLNEQAFQYVVINNKAVKVPTYDVKSIIAGIDEAVLQERLLNAGVRYGDHSPVLRDLNDLDNSPFRRLLDWPYNTTGIRLISLTAMEQSLNYVSSVFEPLLGGSDTGGDEDSLLELFLAMWRGVTARYDEIWGHAEFEGRENYLMKKVSILAINEYITNKIKNAWTMDSVDIFDMEGVEEAAMKFIQPVPDALWLADWNVAIQDNANVRRYIREDMEMAFDNVKLRRPWHTGLRLPKIVEGEGAPREA